MIGSAAAAIALCLAAAHPVHRGVDVSAMEDAIAASNQVEDFASSAAYAHFLSAQLATEAGQPLKASEELRLALASDPGDPYLLTSLADAEARSGKLGQARRLLGSLVRRFPGRLRAHLLLGRVLLDLHRLSGARREARKVIRLDPGSRDAYLLLAQVGLDGNHPAEAEVAVQALWKRTQDPSGFKRLGLAFAERGSLTRAVRLLTRATTLDPDDGEAFAGLGQVEEVLGRNAQAEAAFAAALERDPEDKPSLLAAGRVALRLGALDQARGFFDRLLALGDPDAPLKVAFSYLAANRISDAAKVLDQAQAAGGTRARVPFYAGLLHERAGELDAAARAFAQVPHGSALFHEALLRRMRCLVKSGKAQEALAIADGAAKEGADAPDLLAARAEALFSLGRTDEAERSLEEAIARTGESALYTALARLLDQEDSPKRAVQLLAKVAQKRPRDAALQFALGSAYDRAGDRAEAIAAMKRVLRLDGDNAAAMNFLGYLYAERKENLGEAERLLRRALKLRPDDGAFLDSLGWIYFQEGELARALSALRKAARLSPDEPTIREHLGDAYRSADRRREAAEEYRRALDALEKAGGSGEARAQQESIARKLKLLSTEGEAR